MTHPLTENRRCGTRNYLAPEIIQRRSFNTTTSQIFSFGILLFEYLYELNPEEVVYGTNPSTDPYDLIECHRSDPYLYKKFFQKLCKKLEGHTKKLLVDSENYLIINILHSLIIKCLEPNPAHRPTWESIKETLRLIISLEPDSPVALANS